jgi:DNA-binding transcriptional ArsR family regulator
LAENTDYDRIFAALKHPIRRQILLLLEEKGEVSFTQIQNVVGIQDTGLLSYHLRELSPLVDQSARGKYSLSEIGQASMALFRKVEREKQASTSTVQKYFEKVVGKIVFILFIVGITLMAPLSADIYVSVQTVSSSLSIEQLILLFLASFAAMILGVMLFIFYDRHYFSTKVKTNVVHCLLFATGISLLSIFSTYAVHNFEISTLEVATSANASSVTFLFSILRALAFLGNAPTIAYAMSRYLNRR